MANSALRVPALLVLFASVAQHSNTCKADLNGSGLVTAVDFNIFRGLLNKPPGPSGLVFN